MQNRTLNTLSVSLVILTFLIGISLYGFLPDKIASHWDIAGNVDGYLGKFWGVFLVPTIMAVITLLLVLIPRIDPHRENISKFRKEYNLLVLFIQTFFIFVYLLIILWNIGFRFNFTYFIIPAVGLLFFFLGLIMPRLKRNWFIGIRTPWTLSSERVWDKTHKQGAVVFKFAGILIILSMFFPENIFAVIIILAVVAILWLVVYSYLEFRKEKVISKDRV